MNPLVLLAQINRQPQAPDPAAQAAGGVMTIVCCGFYLVFIALLLVSLWKIFEKAGRPGWEGIIPIYNMYVLTCEIAKKEVLWFILQFIPLVNIVISVMVHMEVAKKFGKSEGFGIGLALLSPIFYPILAFGDARYQAGRRRPRRDEYDDEADDRPRRRRDEYDDDEDEGDRPRRR